MIEVQNVSEVKKNYFQYNPSFKFYAFLEFSSLSIKF